jgi:hypothetical protein
MQCVCVCVGGGSSWLPQTPERWPYYEGQHHEDASFTTSPYTGQKCEGSNGMGAKGLLWSGLNVW